MSGSEAKRAIGLMSGTSMDGIDVAFLLTDGREVLERGPAAEYEYTPKQRRSLEEGIERAATFDTAGDVRAGLAALETDLTDWHAEAIARFERSHSLKADLIGVHGHTVTHRPEAAWTIQLGDGAQLSRISRRPVVHDFRSADMAAGGEGAPLVPIYHLGLAASLATAPTACVAFLNIGGIANATVVRDGAIVAAFDCGPGNVLVDRWVQENAGIPFDAGGTIASEGRVFRPWLEAELAKPFFDRSGPRSLDRLDFSLPNGSEFDLSDGARTLARFTAEAAARSLAAYSPDMTVVCGGGRLNRTIMSDLDELLPGRVETAEASGFDGGAMEAEAFAYLAVRTMNGDPLTFPQTTGCGAPVTGGRVALP